MSSWVKFLDGDLNEFTDDQIREMMRYAFSNMVVVMRNQNLTPETQLRISKVAGDVQPTWFPGRTEGISVIDGVVRVTGKKDEKGLRGIFGHKEVLEWHVNKASNPARKPLISMYGVEGTKGSRTSFLNMIEAWSDLPDDIKEQLKDFKVICGYKKGLYTDSPFHREHINRENPLPLVRTNEEGKTGLFFPFFQAFEFEGVSKEEFMKWKKFLWKHCVQEKYIYDHDWEDGDFIINEQWLCLHKRWAFEGMEERVLHRTAFDPRNIYHEVSYL
jgi:taurine dioxygenase